MPHHSSPSCPLTAAVLEAQNATTARDRERLESEVIRRARPMSWGLASRYAHRGADLDDLRAVADLAVLCAARRFDPERGTFGAYASITVLGEIKKFFRDACWTIRPGRAIQDLQARMSEAVEELQRDGKTATVTSIARHLEVDVETAKSAQAAQSCYSPASLDTSATQESAWLRREIAFEESGYTLSEDRVAAARACRLLNDEERELLRLRFFEDLSQREIADRLGSTQMRVSRELRRLLTVLRSAASAEADLHVEKAPA